MPLRTAPPLIALLIIVVLFATGGPPLRAQDEIAVTKSFKAAR